MGNLERIWLDVKFDEHFLKLIDVMSPFIDDLAGVDSALYNVSSGGPGIDHARSRTRLLRIESSACLSAIAEVERETLEAGLTDERIRDAFRVLYRFIQAQIDLRTDVFARFWDVVRTDLNVDTDDYLVDQAKRIHELSLLANELKHLGVTSAERTAGPSVTA